MHIIIQRVTIAIHVHCTPHEALHFKKAHLKAINKNRSLPVKAIKTKQVQYTLSKFQTTPVDKTVVKSQEIKVANVAVSPAFGVK